MSRASYWITAEGRVVEQIGRPGCIDGVQLVRVRCVVTGSLLALVRVDALAPASKRAVRAARAAAPRGAA